MGELGLLILLGLLQGLTEFLPVSSSGHLVLARSFLPGGERLPADASIEVLLHIGTLVAVIAYYRREIYGLAAGVLGRGSDPQAQRRLMAWLALGTLPAVAVGLLLEERVDRTFAVPAFSAAMLLLTAALLAVSVRLRGPGRGLELTGAHTALLIGCAQALAILPGLSRSGTTIVAGLALGLSLPASATFSFLLSIPTVAGAIALKSPSLAALEVGSAAIAAGILISAAVGFASLGFLAWIGRHRRLWWFAPYCAALGAAGLAASAFSGRP